MARPMTRREKQASETRTDILNAAQKLFAERGYAGTAIADIAAEAGVAVPTVYASVGAKPLLLRHLLDRVDQKAGVAELAAQLGREENPARVLALQVDITRQVAERSGDIIQILSSAAGVEPEMAEAYEAGLERHRAGARATAKRLHALGALPPDRSMTEATAIIATLTSVPVYASMTATFGWSFDRCVEWLNETLAAQLLAHPRRTR